MTNFEIKLKEPVIHHKKIHMPYTHSVGVVSSKFLRALGDNRILAIKCVVCSRTYVPPQGVCPSCFANIDEWVELNGQGTLVTYTVIYYPLPTHLTEPPFALGIIKLDGADTSLVHFLGEVNLDNIKIGMKVKPVFKEKPEGNILDIRYFKPV